MNSPQQIVTNYKEIAKTKTTMSWYKLLILGILAGTFIAFGAVSATVASTGASENIAALLKGAVFPVGLILVVVCGAELFTGNCLLIAPTITKDIKVKGLLKNWGIVYLGNLIGSILIAVLVIFSHVLSESALISTIQIAAKKCSMNFGDVFLRGILCNVLVCLAIWGSMASKRTVGKILMVYFPIFTFVVLGFEHSIANMYYLSAGLFANTLATDSAQNLNVGNAILFSLIPSTLGNVVGGGLLSIAYHVVYKKSSSPTEPQNEE